jgi:hypothetical protein
MSVKLKHHELVGKLVRVVLPYSLYFYAAPAEWEVSNESGNSCYAPVAFEFDSFATNDERLFIVIVIEETEFPQTVDRARRRCSLGPPHMGGYYMCKHLDGIPGCWVLDPVSGKQLWIAQDNLQIVCEEPYEI